jgi:hypothetical protein
MAADEDGIGRGGDCGTAAVYGTEVADAEGDAGGAEAAGVLLDDGFAFRAYLESHDLEVGELQSGLDGDAARAGSDVPKHVATGQVEGLEGQ